MTAGHRHEVALDEEPFRLVLNALDNFGDGDTVIGIEGQVPARVGHWLEVYPADCRMVDAKLDQATDLVLVHPPLDGGYKDGVKIELRQAVESGHFLFQKRLPPELDISLFLETVELEVHQRVQLCQPFGPLRVTGQAEAVGAAKM